MENNGSIFTTKVFGVLLFHLANIIWTTFAKIANDFQNPPLTQAGSPIQKQ